MKAILEFNLPEEKDEHTLAIRGGDYWSSLWDMDQWLRAKIKYSDNDRDFDVGTLQLCRDQLRAIMDSNNVSLEDVQ